MNKRALLFICIGALLLGLTGCTGDGGEATATPIPTMTPQPVATDLPVETDMPQATEELPEDPTGDETDPAATPDPLAEEPETTDGDGGDDGLSLANADPDSTPAGSVVTPGPDETPILIDPIDKPTTVPAVAAYKTYTSNEQKISFEVPLLWSLYKPSESHMQFVEPQEDAEEGYQAKLTIITYGYGANQNAADAQSKLIEVMNELSADGWDSFTFSGDTEKTSMAGASGYYCYFDAEYNEVLLRGRVMMVAKGSSLYQVRITSVRSRYSAYEEIYRNVRSTWKFL